MKRAQYDSAQLSRTGRALLAAGALTVIIGLAALFIPPLIGVPIVPETFYDGVIGAVAAALIGGAYAVGITLYVLRRSLDQQAALHENSMDAMRRHHAQMLRQQARAVRVENTYSEGAALATASRRLVETAQDPEMIGPATKAFAAAVRTFTDRAHHVELENAARQVERAAAAAITSRELLPALVASAEHLYFMTCAYLRGESLSGVDSDPVLYESAPGRFV